MQYKLKCACAGRKTAGATNLLGALGGAMPGFGGAGGPMDHLLDGFTRMDGRAGAGVSESKARTVWWPSRFLRQPVAHLLNLSTSGVVGPV